MAPGISVAYTLAYACRRFPSFFDLVYHQYNVQFESVFAYSDVLTLAWHLQRTNHRSLRVLGFLCIFMQLGKGNNLVRAPRHPLFVKGSRVR